MIDVIKPWQTETAKTIKNERSNLVTGWLSQKSDTVKERWDLISNKGVLLNKKVASLVAKEGPEN